MNFIFEDKQMRAVYDMTIGYPDLLPQNEMDAIFGVFPKNVHFHIKRYKCLNKISFKFLLLL